MGQRAALQVQLELLLVSSLVLPFQLLVPPALSWLPREADGTCDRDLSTVHEEAMTSN